MKNVFLVPCHPERGFCFPRVRQNRSRRACPELAEGIPAPLEAPGGRKEFGRRGARSQNIVSLRPTRSSRNRRRPLSLPKRLRVHSQHVHPKHPPDRKDGDDGSRNVNYPVASGFWLAKIEHVPMGAGPVAGVGQGFEHYGLISTLRRVQGASFQTSYRMFSRFFKGKPSLGKTL